MLLVLPLIHSMPSRLHRHRHHLLCRHRHHACFVAIAIAITPASPPHLLCRHRHHTCFVADSPSPSPCPGCHHEGWPCHLRQRKQQHNNDEGIGRMPEDYYTQEVRLEEEEDQVGLFVDLLTSITYKLQLSRACYQPCDTKAYLSL